SPSRLPGFTGKTWQTLVSYLWNLPHHRTTTGLPRAISSNSPDCARHCKRVEPSPPHCKVSRSSCNISYPIAKWKWYWLADGYHSERLTMRARRHERKSNPPHLRAHFNPSEQGLIR